jgi:hypothetical protein
MAEHAGHRLPVRDRARRPAPILGPGRRRPRRTGSSIAGDSELIQRPLLVLRPASLPLGLAALAQQLERPALAARLDEGLAAGLALAVGDGLLTLGGDQGSTGLPDRIVSRGEFADVDAAAGAGRAGRIASTQRRASSAIAMRAARSVRIESSSRPRSSRILARVKRKAFMRRLRPGARRGSRGPRRSRRKVW